MRKAIGAAAIYFAIVFAAGFALGAVRVTTIAPAIGEVAATFVELPVILFASWRACVFVIRRLDVEPTARARIVMGAAAFALLMAAEITLGTGFMKSSLHEKIAAMTSGAGLVGLGGQVLYALFPLIALLRRR